MKKTINLLLVLASNFFLSQNNFTRLTPNPSDSKAVKITFSNNDLGFIINNNKELLSTNDKGVTWNLKQTLNFTPLDIKFRNNIGFIVGDNVVLRSDNYGVTWSPVNIVGGSSFNSINFISDDVVYISGQTKIFKSSDKGLTFPVNTTINGMSAMITVFTNADTAIATTSDGRIQRTVDGGNTWVTTASDTTSNPQYFSVVFPSQNVGFVSKRYGNMLKTTDGGQTWTTTSNYNSYQAAAYGMQFFDENNGFTVGENGMIFKTTNGGSSWQMISPILLFGSYNSDYDLNGMYFFDSQTAICTGNNGRTIKTQDGGTNWTDYAPTYDLINELHFTTTNTAYFKTNKAGFFKTSDAGNSWQKVQFPPHQGSLSNGFTFINDNLGYSIGTVQGWVYKTTDGAQTWSSSSVIQDNPLHSVSFASENVGYVSGGYSNSNGGLFKTENGSTTWQKISNMVFGKLKFFNNNLGYGLKYEYQGQLYKTLDGGVTWNVCLNVPVNNIIYDIINENQIFALVNNTDFYRSLNGGATWTQSQAPNLNFGKIKFIDQNTGYMANDRWVFKTADGGANWNMIYDNNSRFTISNMEVGGDYLYLTGNGGRVYKYSLEFLSASETTANKKANVQIYPNPTSDYVHVDSKVKVKEIRLIDISGKTLKSVKDTSQISIAEYQSGMYFVEIIFGDNTKQVNKIIRK